MKTLLFVGECRSLTAQRRGWTWEDGRLAAKPLFEALEAMGVDPRAHEYTNLWTDPPLPSLKQDLITQLKRVRRIVVALGSRVSGQLEFFGVDHVALVHPAARGKIRKRERYHAHVRDKLTPHVAPRKVVVVRCGLEDEADSYVFFVVTKRGRRRVYPPGYEGRGEAAACPSDVVESWLKKLRVTHVTSEFGESKTSPECIKDGTYTTSAYVKWWRRAEADD